MKKRKKEGKKGRKGKGNGEGGMEERQGKKGKGKSKRIAIHTRIGNSERGRDHNEFIGIQARQYAGPGQIDKADFNPQAFTHLGKKLLVEAFLFSVLQKIERRKLHFRTQHQNARLFDPRQLILGMGDRKSTRLNSSH